jgi:hypothetical protein
MSQKLHHKLKKVIHPNRYFIWALFLLLISAVSLASYIMVTAYSFDRSFVFADIATRKVFTDHQAAYSVRYPNNWVLERGTGGNMTFENPENSKESITISPGALDIEPIIKNSLHIQVERNIARDNLKIDFIQSGDSKQGDEVFNVAIIKTPQKLFYVSGYSPVFEQFVNNFRAE